MDQAEKAEKYRKAFGLEGKPQKAQAAGATGDEEASPTSPAEQPDVSDAEQRDAEGETDDPAVKQRTAKRIQDLLAERKEAQDERDRLRRELEELKGGKDKNLVDAVANGTEVSAEERRLLDLAGKMADRIVAERLQSMQDSLGHVDVLTSAIDPQALARARTIAELRKGSPGLKDDELIMLAKVREPELFSAGGSSGGFDAATHGVQPPASSSPQREPKKKEQVPRLQDMLNEQDPHERQRLRHKALAAHFEKQIRDM